MFKQKIEAFLLFHIFKKFKSTRVLFIEQKIQDIDYTCQQANYSKYRSMQDFSNTKNFSARNVIQLK